MCTCEIKMTKILVAVTTVLLLLETTTCCFIRNCPPGGKRSMDLMSRGVRPCLSCGPGNTGQCIGPSVCCGPFGCYFGTPEARACAKENDSNTPCEVRGRPCGSHDQGNCVSDGICCDGSACSFNSKCQSGDGADNKELLSLLNTILQSRDLE